MNAMNTDIEKTGGNAAKKIKNSYSDMTQDVKSAYSDMKSGVKSEFPEIDDIRKDVVALRKDVSNLMGHAYSNTGKYVDSARDYTAHQWEKMQTLGREGIEKIQEKVAEKPSQTLAVAFLAGIAASFFLRRR